MTLLIRQAGPEGQPLPGAERFASGEDFPALVRAMMEQTAFTAEMHPLDYMNRTLMLLGRHTPPLPQDGEAAAEEFLRRLAEAELIRFIPGDWPDFPPVGKKEK